jgi:hypothetical protein
MYRLWYRLLAVVSSIDDGKDNLKIYVSADHHIPSIDYMYVYLMRTACNGSRLGAILILNTIPGRSS